MTEALRDRDLEARRRALTIFDRPFVLEAGAGTGKTETLVARILAWCLGPGWEGAAHALPGAADDAIAARALERVVAITFTEAAASEMANRVTGALAALLRSELPPGLVEEALPEVPQRSRRAQALLARSDRLVVRTIHAWCRRLLSTFPLEADVHPDFRVDPDERRLSEIVREVVEARLRPAYAEPGDPLFLALATWRYGPREIEETLLRAASAGLPPEALEADPFPRERVTAFLTEGRESLARFRACEQGRLAGVPRSASRTHEVDAALREIASLVETADASRAGLQKLADELRELWDRPNQARVRDWSRGRFNRGEQSQLGKRAGEVAESAGPLERWLRVAHSLEPDRLEVGRRVLGPLLADVAARLRARGVETFGALLRHARRLLEEHESVRRRVQRELDQLVVDEFQDTDATQCAILRALALDGPAQSRPGLFIVGDPKQSIYGWRQADLAAYDGFVREVLGAGGVRERLFVNYRSRPAILDEVNEVVAPVMRREPGLQAEYEPLLAHRGAGPEATPVEYWVSWLPDPETGAVAKVLAADRTELEARAVARDIVRVRAETGVAWSEIGLLLRSRSDLDAYLEALRAADIPFWVEGDRNFFRRREIIDAAAAVRCVVDPNDQVSLLTWLRSACVGVPDAALIPLWSRELPGKLARLVEPDVEALDDLHEIVLAAAAATPPDIPGLARIRGWEHSLLSAIETLAISRESFERDPPDVFVERLRTRTLIDATEAARYLGRYRVANLERFWRRLTEDLCTGSGDPQAVLRTLRRRVREAEEEEEARPVDRSEDAVQIRTIHQAKGLDFTHVYLVQTHKRPTGPRDDEGSFGEVGGRTEYLLFGAPTLGFEGVRERAEAVARAEQVRTLYVALTRAKSRLVIAGSWPEGGRVPDPEGALCHLDLLGARARGVPDLLELWSRLRARGRHAQNLEGVRWSFPGLARGARGPRRARTRRPDALVSPDRVARDATRLAERRRTAAARMARPLRGRASAEEREGQSGVAASPRAGGALDVAAAVGSAIHSVLEDFDPSARSQDEQSREHAELRKQLERGLPADRLEAALARGTELLGRFQRGPLFAKLRDLGPGVAREVPILTAPGEAGDAPLGYVEGVIDLLYRDPHTSEWVVADYKTDRVESEGEIEAIVERYRAQGAVYTEAIRSGFALSRRPRFELWLLHPGRVVPG